MLASVCCGASAGRCGARCALATAARRGAARVAVGERAEARRTFDAAAVRAFADLSGDDNPLHLDAAFAATTRFGAPIVHGWLVSSLLSGLLGTRLPGVGAVYVSQSVKFVAPVYVDEPLTARVEVAAVERKMVTLATRVWKTVDGVDTDVVTGEAVTYVPHLEVDSAEA